MKIEILNEFDSTRSMTRVGQALWDDIKILGHKVGHLISIFQAIWDTSLTHEA